MTNFAFIIFISDEPVSGSITNELLDEETKSKTHQDVKENNFKLL